MAPKKEVGCSSEVPVKRGRGRPPKRGRGGGGRDGGGGRGRGRGGDAVEVTEEDGRSPSPVRSSSLVGGDACKMHTSTLHYNSHISIIFASYKGYIIVLY